MRSLTREEAEQRSRLLRVVRYDVAVDLTGLLDGPEVRCTSTVTFSSGSGDSFVDCAAQVLAATLDGRPLPPPQDGRIGLSGLGGEHVLVVTSVQAETTTGEGVHRAVDPADGEVYVWTSFEPDEARHVWACFDQPDLKAPHAFTVLAPARWTVLSNSGTARVEDRGDARRWHFPDTPPLSTYTTVVDAGPFVELRREAAGHDLGLYARRSLATVLERDADALFALTAQGLAFFEDVFAMPFPQHRYDQVFVPEFGGAMENHGCVTWADTFLRPVPQTPAEADVFARYLLHELAHMWFGNVVTLRWWDDLWLNEAFAEFAAHWCAVRATPHTDLWAAHLAGEELRAYLADRGPGSHPVRMPVPDVAAAAAAFDAVTYPKGASVLLQLLTWLGEDAFTAGLRQYVARHAWGSATVHDLVAALTEASGRDVASWCAGWLDVAGTDRLVLDDALVLHASGPAGPPRPHVLTVAAYDRVDDHVVRTAAVRVDVEGARTPVALPPADLHLVNDDDLTFASVRPAPAQRQALLDLAALLPTPVARGVAVASVWDMLLDGDATAAEAARCLARVLPRETSPSVVEPFLVLAADAAELWAPDADRPALSAVVADACWALAERPATRRVALRALTRTGDDADLDRLAREAPDDVDLGWRALLRRAERGSGVDAAVADLLARDPDPAAPLRALAVRAARPSARDKEAAWQALAEQRSVPLGALREVATAFWRPGQDPLLVPYAERYLDALPGFAAGGFVWSTALCTRLFPAFAVDRAFLDRAVERASEGPPVVATSVAERADVAARQLRSRGTA